MTATVVSILERAVAALPGATESMLRAEFQALVKDFCRQSRAWRLMLRDVATTNMQIDLLALPAPLGPLPGVPLGAIGAIQNGDRWITPRANRHRDWAGGDSPLHYYAVPPTATTLAFWPTPDVELSELRIEIYLTPYSAGTIPDDLCFHYDEALLAGLKGRMMLLPKKPYTDEKSGPLAMTEYRQGINQARHQANKSRTTGPEPWHYPGWG